MVSFCRKKNKKEIIKNKLALPGCNKNKKIPLCTCLRGSYTLEAAVIFPLVAGLMVSILFFFRVIQIEMHVKTALAYAARKTAVSCSRIDSDMLTLSSAEVLFKSKLAESNIVCNYVSGGMWGVSLIGSEVNGDNVNLEAKYKVKLPINFFSVDGIWIEQHSNSRKWTGKDIEKEIDPYVFYTEYGEVYHLSEQCNYLDLSISSVGISQISNLRNKSGHKYSACTCTADKNANDRIVFITDYGEEYHAKLGCSDLKRTVHMAHLSEIGEKRVCSKCKGET